MVCLFGSLISVSDFGIRDSAFRCVSDFTIDMYVNGSFRFRSFNVGKVTVTLLDGFFPNSPLVGNMYPMNKG